MMRDLIWLFPVVSMALGATLLPRNASFACNNSPDLCNRAYNEVTYLGAHDSAFLRNASNGFSDSGNQDVNTTAQLTAGVRLVSAQVHNSNGAWHLCHTSCDLLDAGLLSVWLGGIKSWMDNNPHDVVTVLLVNSDNASIDQLHSEFQAANITSYAYTPPNRTTALATTWPTLQDMVANNTRLVTFVASLPPAGNTVAPYLLDEFTFVFENPFDVTSLSGFSCAPERPPTLQGNIQTAISSGRMPLMNHFLDTIQVFGVQTPDIGNITITNANSGAIGNLGVAAANCTTLYGKAPNFILVDFFDNGTAITTVDSLNKITPVGRGDISTALTQSKSGSMGRGDILNGQFGLWKSWVGGAAAIGVTLQLSGALF